MALFQLGGAVARIGEEATAYRGRSDAFTLNIATAWVDPDASQRYIAATSRFADAMAPHSAGTYTNFQAETDEARTGAAYGEAKYRRLVGLKGRCDPDNFFRLNHNIRPEG